MTSLLFLLFTITAITFVECGWIADNIPRIVKAGYCAVEGDVIGNCPANSPISDSFKQWSTKIPFAFSVNSFYQNAVRNVLKHISNNTCLKFIEPKADKLVNRAHLKITGAEDMCAISEDKIGDTGKVAHLIYIGKSCGNYLIIGHLLMHALGLRHEMNREDRADWIYVNLNNVLPENHKHFHIAKGGNRYDFDSQSIMNFHRNEFADIKGVPIVIPLRASIDPFQFASKFNTFSDVDSTTARNDYGFSSTDFKKIRYTYCKE